MKFQSAFVKVSGMRAKGPSMIVTLSLRKWVSALLYVLKKMERRA